MNAAERLDNYANIVETEAARELPQDPDQDLWPMQGRIEIKSLEVCYKTGDQRPVIQDLNLSIAPKQKIGVVGRTGSGKSTLLTALFRIVEPTKGSISIDGIDHQQLGLKSLRKGI